MRVVLFTLFILLNSLVVYSQLQLKYESAVEVIPLHRAVGDYGDLDNDGDLDIVITGMDRFNTPLTFIYELKDGEFIQKDIDLPNVSHGEVTIGDLNGDGLNDFVITGTTYDRVPSLQFVGSIDERVSMEVFINQGSWQFSKINFPFKGFLFNDVDLVDYDNDNDLDIFVSGFTYAGGDNVTKSIIYDNDGNLNFTEKEVELPELAYVESDWYDFNDDGFPDLAITGSYVNRVREGKIFTNNGDFGSTNSEGQMTIFDALPVTMKTSYYEEASLEWVDLNKDGLLDLVQTGDDLLVYYFNKGQSDFEMIDTGIETANAWSYAQFGDLNYDGNIDIFIKSSGLRVNQEFVFTDGNFGFAGPNIDYVDTTRRTSSFGLLEDFNDDGKLDVFLLGNASYDGADSHYYTVGTGINAITVASPPSGAENSVAIDFDLDGDLDVIAAGNFNSNFYWFRNDGNDIYEIFTLENLPKLESVRFDLGDFNGDELPDMFLTGLTEDEDVFSQLYVHTETHQFAEINPPFSTENVWFGTVRWFDYDHDGDLDLFFCGAQEEGISNSSGTVPNDLGFFIYKNVYDSLTYDRPFVPVDNNIKGVIQGHFDFADMDNDGFEELVIAGKAEVTEDDLNGNNLMMIYSLKTDLSGYEQTTEFASLFDSGFGLGDINLDGYIDIAISGKSSNQVFEMFWMENMQNGAFEEYDLRVDQVAIPLSAPSIHVLDYNKDTRPDIILSGKIEGGGPTSYLLINNESAEGTPEFTRIIQSGRISFSSLFGDSNLGDFDADGDADFMISGRSGGLRFFENLSINDGIQNYSSPVNSPVNVTVDVNGYNVELSWENPNDIPVTYKILLDDGSADDLTFEAFTDEPNKHLNRGIHGSINVPHYEFFGLKDKDYDFKILTIGPGLETPAVIETGSFSIATPYAPIELNAQIISDNEVRLFWVDVSFSETGYEIERALNRDFTESVFVSTNANTEEYNDDDLTPGTTYYYRIRAVNNAVKSPPSGFISARTSGKVTSLEDNSVAKSIKIIPNPSEDHVFTLQIDNLNVQRIQITDLNGKVVLEEIRLVGGENQEIRYNLGHIDSGVYLIRVETHSNTVGVKKLMLK